MRIIGGKHRGAKLYTLEGAATRPTLDRVKEPLFSILQFRLPDAAVLDLFAGSGALGLEALSRGAKRAFLCDKTSQAVHIIGKNVEKLNAETAVQILQRDYVQALEEWKQEKFDVIFLDPPYETNFAEKALEKIMQYELLTEDGIVVVETDRKEVVEGLEKIDLLEIEDIRKYGRVQLVFLRQKERIM